MNICYILYFLEQALIRRLWGSHSGDYEEFYPLGYNIM
jgi:hypothetical protein